MHKQQQHPHSYLNFLTRALPASLLLCACQGIAYAAITTTPPPIIDTDPPTSITIYDSNVTPIVGPQTFDATRPVITLDMATQVAASIKATDAPSAGGASADFPGYPTDQIGPLAPGRHTITWTATDVGSNNLTKDQIIDVLPQVNFAVNQKAGAGNTTIKVTAYLSGNAPSLSNIPPTPVSIPFSVNSASSISCNPANYSIQPQPTSPLLITAGTEADIIISTTNNNAEGCTITLDMGTPTGAKPGNKVSHTLTLTKNNLAPITTITATQGSGITHTITTSSGAVTLSATVYDPDNGDTTNTSAYDWSASDNALVPTSGTTSRNFTFNPAGLTPGIYTARLTVRDNNGAASTRDIQLRVYTTAPTLSTSDDSDDDGISDNTEGLKDSDGDGIPDYLDAVSNSAWLQGWDLLTYKANLKRSDSFVSGPITFAWQLDKNATTITSNRVYYPLLLATEPGLKLSIGPTAFANGSNHGRIDTAAASLHFGSSLPANIVSADGQVVDVEISGLGTTGQSVYLVIPLAAPLPPNSPNLKVMGANHTWQDFSNQGTGQGAGNTLLFKTDKDSDNYCPPPANGSYTAVATGSNALNGGVSCIELLIEDGGPNDYDGQKNGIIRLLGAPFITSNTTSNGGATTPPEFNGATTGSVESLNKTALTDGGGGIGFIGAWGVLGLVLAYGARLFYRGSGFSREGLPRERFGQRE